MRAHGVPNFPDPTGTPPSAPEGNVSGIRVWDQGALTLSRYGAAKGSL
jgi:hypothetical protein